MINNSLFRSTVLAITATFGLSACAALNDDQTKVLPINEIYSASTCNIQAQGITAIKDKGQLQQVMKKANAHRLDSKLLDLSLIDFRSSHVFLITMGTRPNSGYSLTRTGNEARLEDSALHLPIKVNLPEKDRMYAQVMTSPCIVIAVTAGIYDTINIEGMDTLKYN
jgi:hypothetical protein